MRHDRAKIGERWRRTCGAVATGVCVALLAGFTLFAATVARHAAGRDLPPVTLQDGIVVLTGGEGRIVEAMRIFDERQARRLLISGVHATTRREELRRRAALAGALFDCCVDVGYAALDTIGNAEETRAWAEAWGFRRLIVVTSSYHMPRSLIEFARAMPDVVLIPHAVAPKRSLHGAWWLEPDDLRVIAIEYVKTLAALVRLAVSRLRDRAAPAPHVLPRDAFGAAAAAFVPGEP